MNEQEKLDRIEEHRIEEYLIELIVVEDREVGFTGNAVHTIFNDLKRYFSSKGLKNIKIWIDTEKPIIYPNVIDIFIYPDGIDYAGNIVYASLCQKPPLNRASNGGRYYTYIYKKIKKITIDDEDST